ncbi:MAG: anion-transporting ArsA/GET3 family ATPase [Bradymonadia bacterium]|jgi:anion-transporting  ArsA/GET3 family ATPase
MILKVRAIYRAVFENRVVSKLLRVMPGLPELTMLGKAYYHEQQEVNGKKHWDVVIIDAPATGHGMFLLQIPQVVTSALNSGRMANEAQRMLDLLEDKERTCVNLITLAEDMPVNETIELRKQIAAEFDIRIGAIIANAVLPRQLEAGDADIVSAMLGQHGTEADDLGSLMSAALFRDRRCDLQERYLRKLRRELDAPIVEVPFFFDTVIDRSVIERMGVSLAEGLGGVE